MDAKRAQRDADRAVESQTAELMKKFLEKLTGGEGGSSWEMPTTDPTAIKKLLELQQNETGGRVDCDNPNPSPCGAPAGVNTLILIPSNNCARVWLFVTLNGLEDVVQLKGPHEFGGLKSETYRKINPLGKLPALILADGAGSLFESQVILNYIADKYSERCKISCRAADALTRAKADLIVRIHDMYISGPNCTKKGYYANQSIAYKTKMSMKERAARFLDIRNIFDILEDMFDATGPWAAGETLTFADIVLHPTFAFLQELAPRALPGWIDPFWSRPKLAAWYKHCCANPKFAEVTKDIVTYAKTFTQPEKILSQLEAYRFDKLIG